MENEKTIALSFRVTPRMKCMLAAAAAHERRSLTNMLEALVADYCRRHRIRIVDAGHNKTSGTKNK
jgi:hypothetical protein